MARLLVTGGAGFIGSNFVHYWLREHPGDRVVVLDALTYAGNLANLQSVATNPHYRFVRGDINDRELVERLLREETLDTIVHFAAESHVDRSITGPGAFVQTNVLGTYALLEATRQVWLKERSVERHRFHHVSTDEVYGSLGPDDPAFCETTPYAPNSPYSATKAASDQLVRAYHHTYGLQTTTSNCSNNYGPYHFPEKLIPLLIVNILQGRPLPIYGDGRNVRDWLHVSDHCRGIDSVLSKGVPGEVYNIGGGSESTNLDLVRLLCRIADQNLSNSVQWRRQYSNSPIYEGRTSESLIKFVPDRPGHDRRYAINCDKIQKDTGYRARVALEQGLSRTFEWYLRNESWWREVLSGNYQHWMKTHYGHTASA